MAKAKDKRSFDQLLEELEQTVAQLERGNIQLEEMLTLHAAGRELICRCRERLDAAEQALALATEGEATHG